jgi:hypothetical protein
MRKSAEKRAFKIILDKYQADPEGFLKYLPELTGIVDTSSPGARVTRSPFGLTERERKHHVGNLARILAASQAGINDESEAIRALEHCATLIRDDSLPTEYDHVTLVALLKPILGKSPGSFKAISTVTIKGAEQREVINHVSLIRGVVLNLDRNAELVSVTVTPRKVRERRKLLAIIGVARDSEPDVALRHDHYLTQVDPHATA